MVQSYQRATINILIYFLLALSLALLCSTHLKNVHVYLHVYLIVIVIVVVVIAIHIIDNVRGNI